MALQDSAKKRILLKKKPVQGVSQSSDEQSGRSVDNSASAPSLPTTADHKSIGSIRMGSDRVLASDATTSQAQPGSSSGLRGCVCGDLKTGAASSSSQSPTNPLANEKLTEEQEPTKQPEKNDVSRRRDDSNKRVQKKKSDEMIETETFVYEGVTYLIDKKKNVYTYDIDRPRMVGIKLIDDSIKFYDASEFSDVA
jgi:hypothetical protein